MRYNFYKLMDDFKITLENPDELDSEIKERLIIIENEIANEYLKKQEGKLGIKKLGNEIRYNPILKKQFNTLLNNRMIIKMTENRRAFIKVFLDAWIAHNSSEIFYFILENSFGNESNVVDNSFIRINEIREELDKFHSSFKKTTAGPNVFFIEIKGLSNYHIIENNGYTNLQLNY